MFQSEKFIARQLEAEALSLWLSSFIEDETVKQISENSNKLTSEYTSKPVNNETNERDTNKPLNINSNKNLNEPIIDFICHHESNCSDSNDNRKRKREYYSKNREEICKKKRMRYRDDVNIKHRYYQENRERIRKYYRENRERLCEYYQRKYYRENRERIREYYRENLERIREHYEENRKQICDIRHEYYGMNREKERSQQSKYYELNREQIRGEQSKYYQENRERICSKVCTYYQQNRDRILCSRTDERTEDYHENSYREDIRKGPTMICISCDRLFFDYSMSMLTFKQMLKKCTLDFLKVVCPLGSWLRMFEL